MSLLVLEQANLSFGRQEILSQASVRLSAGDRLGVVGPNGSGKSTLLRVLCGQQALDGGTVRSAKGVRVGYLPQDILELGGDTLLGSVLATVPGRVEIEDRLQMVTEALEASDDGDEQLQLAMEMGEVREQLTHFETYYSEQRARQILAGLGFPQQRLDRPTAELSGGWKMRAAMAGLLFQTPDVLLFDEPTNHLDMPTVRWLDKFLTSVKGALVLICHDREFLNRQVNRIVAFDPEGTNSYRGNYDAYLHQREAQREVREAATRNKERELRDLQRFVDRFRAKANKARQAQSRAKQVVKITKQLQEQRAPTDRHTLSFSFPPINRSGRDVLRAKKLSKAFGELELYRDVDLHVQAGERIAIIGINGAGKTTLLKLLDGELEPDQGEVTYGANVEIGYYAQHHAERLYSEHTVLEEVWRFAPGISETIARSVCGSFLFSGDDVEKPVAVLSGGERARVLLAQLLVRPGNLMLMDEPTNHLDITSAEALAQALTGYEGTLLFVSHNNSFVNRLATKVWDVVDGKIVEYPGNLDDYLAAQQMMEQQAAAKLQAPAASTTPATRATKADATAPKESQSERKTRKRQEAEHRNALGKKTSRTRKRIAELENRIGRLEQQQKEFEPQLADPALYQDQARFLPILHQFNGNQEKLAELYERWEHHQERLQELETAG